MKIPVFHDDQHGTAIISGAALLNAPKCAGKKLDETQGRRLRRGRGGDRLRADSTSSSGPARRTSSWSTRTA